MNLPIINPNAKLDDYDPCLKAVWRALKVATCNEPGCEEKAAGSTPDGYKCNLHWEFAWLEAEGEYVTPEMREKWMEGE